jgi:hypothetical protein
MSKLREEIAARFQADVRDHEMAVVKDDGVHRHLTFRRPTSSVFRFDLLTWPGHLCITGDYGTYVFSRIPDMFEFFRGHEINPRYWDEKLLSVSRHGGYREFDPETFKERVREHFVDHWEDTDDHDARDACWDEVVADVLSRVDDGEHVAYQAVNDFQHGRFCFQDFFDGGGTERFTDTYLWNLNAIVWGISHYDQMRADVAETATPTSPARRRSAGAGMG